MRTLTEGHDQFAYHPATEVTAPQHEAVRGLFLQLVDDLWRTVPDGPEKTLAFRKLQEAQMFANLAVALTAPAVAPGTVLLVREVPADRG